MQDITPLPVNGTRLDALAEFGRCADVRRLFGIKRGKLYELLDAGLVKSVSLREPGKKFGCRLIHLESVRQYLTALMHEQNGDKGAANPKRRRLKNSVPTCEPPDLEPLQRAGKETETTSCNERDGSHNR